MTHGFQADRPSTLWQIDHQPLSIWLIDEAQPIADPAITDASTHAQITALLDVKTGVAISFTVSLLPLPSSAPPTDS